GDDVVQVVVRRVTQRAVVVGALDAGRGHEENAVGAGVGDGAVQRPAVAAAGPAVVGDPRPVRHRVVQRCYGVGSVARAAGPEDLQGHKLHLPIDAGDADRIVPQGPDGAGDVGAVVVVVEGVVVIVDEVPADEVVDVTVAVSVEEPDRISTSLRS